MILVLSRYLLKQFLMRVLFLTLALAGILLVFDLLGNIVSVTSHRHDAVQAVFYYLMLRCPSIITLSLPLGVLLAAMATLIRLVNYHELTMFSASGITIYYVARILMGGAVIVALIHFLLANTLVSATAPRLEAWAKNDYRDRPPPVTEASLPGGWIIAGNFLLNAANISTNRHVLDNVTMIERDSNGLILYYYKARQARYEIHGWRLYDLNGKDIRNNAIVKPAMDIDLPLKPKDLSASGTIENLSLFTLWRVAHAPETSARTNYLYSLWIQQKLAEPFAGLIMVLMAMPLAFQQARRNNILTVSFGVIAAGFCYFMAERLLLSLGETGTLPPFWAVWSPLMIFGIMGWWFLLYKQE